jgi:hypothetical protein
MHRHRRRDEPAPPRLAPQQDRSGGRRRPERIAAPGELPDGRRETADDGRDRTGRETVPDPTAVQASDATYDL